MSLPSIDVTQEMPSERLTTTATFQPGYAEPKVGEPPRGLLFEREAPEAVLREMLADVRSGRGGHTFLVAPAGFGKTALLDAVVHQWRDEGLRVGHAVANSMERAIPFGLLDQSIYMLGGTNAIEDITNVDFTEPSSSRLYRTWRWLEEACARDPLLLALDDLHWSDDDSLELLNYLCRRIAHLPIVILATLRPEPDRAHQFINDLVSNSEAKLISLGALSKHASSALSTQILEREVTEIEAEAIWHHSAGTPLLIKIAAETLRQGSSISLLKMDEKEGLQFDLERFAGVEREALYYAKAASIFGVRFRRSQAAQLARVQDDGGVSAHEQLVRAKLVVDLGGGWSRFVHPLFAQNLLASLTPSTREEFHGRAFRLLVDAGLPDGEAAEHAYAGALVGDPLAIEVSARVGQSAAAQGAFEAAATHLAHAVELAGDRASLSLRFAHAGVLVALTRVEEARVLCEGILTDHMVTASVRSDVLRLLAQAAHIVSQPEDAQRLFDEAAAAVTNDPPAEGRMLLYAVLTCHGTSKVPWTETTTRRALDLLPESAVEYATLELVHAYALLLGGDPAGAEIIESALTSWRTGSFVVDSSSRWTVAFLLQGATKLFEHYEDSAQVLETEYQRGRRDGSPILIATTAISYTDNLHRLGRVPEAIALVDEATSISRYTMTPWSNVANAALYLELDQDDEVARHLAELENFVASVPYGYGAIAAMWRDLLEARRLLEAGRPEEASDLMSDARALSVASGVVHPLVVPWAPVGIEAHLRAGRYDLVESLIDHLDVLAHRLDLRWPTAVVALGRAQLTAAVGDSDVADGLFEAAIKAHHSTEMPIFCAEALLAYGAHLRRTRRVIEARAPLREAVTLAEASGSARVARQALAELAVAGGRHPRPHPSSTALTSREIEVARLASEGRSNAEIGAALYLSVKTVEHHLGHVYLKLGMSSRRALIGRQF